MTVDHRIWTVTIVHMFYPPLRCGAKRGAPGGEPSLGARRVVILDPSVFVQESPEKECVDFPTGWAGYNVELPRLESGR